MNLDPGLGAFKAGAPLGDKDAMQVGEKRGRFMADCRPG